MGPPGNLCYLGGILKEEKETKIQVRRKQVRRLFQFRYAERKPWASHMAQW